MHHRQNLKKMLPIKNVVLEGPPTSRGPDQEDLALRHKKIGEVLHVATTKIKRSWLMIGHHCRTAIARKNMRRLSWRFQHNVGRIFAETAKR